MLTINAWASSLLLTWWVSMVKLQATNSEKKVAGWNFVSSQMLKIWVKSSQSGHWLEFKSSHWRYDSSLSWVISASYSGPCRVNEKDDSCRLESESGTRVITTPDEIRLDRQPRFPGRACFPHSYGVQKAPVGPFAPFFTPATPPLLDGTGYILPRARATQALGRLNGPKVIKHK